MNDKLSKTGEKQLQLSNISDKEIIKAYEERLEINKQWQKSGELTVERKTEVKRVEIKDTVNHATAKIETVPVGKYVDHIPEQRQESGVLYIPVYEEHIEIVKKIYLKEEIKITHQEQSSDYYSEEQLRYQTIYVTRTSTDK